MAGGQAVKMIGPWHRVGAQIAAASKPSTWRAAMDRAMGQEAHRLHRIIVKAFNAQGPKGKKWKPLSNMTIAMRRVQNFRGRKALMRGGDLRRSVKVVKEGHVWFVGVHRSAKGSNGVDLVDIASVHEHGSKGDIRITVNDKVRNFFLAMHLKSTTPAQRKRMAKAKRKGGKGPRLKFAIMPLKPSTTTLVIRIPARPFIGPVWDAEEKTVARNIQIRTLRGVGLGQFAGQIR